MSTPFRIFGCFILGLVAMGFAYERVINARAEGARSLSAVEESEMIEPVIEAIAPEDTLASDEDTIQIADVYAVDPEARASSLPDVNNPTQQEEIPTPNSESEPVISADSIDDVRGESDGTAEPVTVTEDKNFDDPSITDETTVKTVSEIITDTDVLTDAEEVSVEAEAIMPSAPNLKSPPFEESVEREPVSLLTRIIHDEADFLGHFRDETGSITNRRLLHADGALKFPYKIMPEEWLISSAPIAYPENCTGDAGPKETVTVKFRVDALGRAYRPKLADVTNACFTKNTVDAVRNMRFRVRAAPGYYVGGSTFLINVEYEKMNSQGG